MTRTPLRGGGIMTVLRRFGSFIVDLVLAAIFLGLWLMVITRGEELSLWR